MTLKQVFCNVVALIMSNSFANKSVYILRGKFTAVCCFVQVTHYPDRDIATVRDVDFGLHDLVKCLLDDNPTSRCFDVASVYNH